MRQQAPFVPSHSLPLTLPASLSPLPLLQHFTAPIPATPSDFRAAFSFVYEPQLSAERAAAAAAASGAAPAAPSASAGKDVDRDESANPAKVLDGLLLGLLGGLRGSGGAGGKQQPTEVRGGVAYPAEDIAALNAAKRFLVNVSGRGGPQSFNGLQECWQAVILAGAHGTARPAGCEGLCRTLHSSAAPAYHTHPLLPNRCAGGRREQVSRRMPASAG